MISTAGRCSSRASASTKTIRGSGRPIASGSSTVVSGWISSGRPSCAPYRSIPTSWRSSTGGAMMVWNWAPINLVQTDRWLNPKVPRAAVKVNQEMVLRDRGHPSVLVFSVAERARDPGHGAQRRFLRAAAAAVRRHDPTRMVALDRVARYGPPTTPTRSRRIRRARGQRVLRLVPGGAQAPPPRLHPPSALLLRRLAPPAAPRRLVRNRVRREGDRLDRREQGTYAFQADYLGRHIDVA